MAYRGCKRISPLIFILGPRWKLVVNCMSQTLYCRKIVRWVLNSRLVGPQIRYKLYLEKLEITDPYPEFELRLPS